MDHIGRIGPDQIVQPLHVAQVRDRELPQGDELLRRRISLAPPEAGAGMLMPRAEDQRNRLAFGRLEAQHEIGDLVEPAFELFVVLAARNDRIDGARPVPRVSARNGIGAMPRNRIDGSASECRDDVLAHFGEKLSVDIGLHVQLDVGKLPAADCRMAARQVLRVRKVGVVAGPPFPVVVQTVQGRYLMAEHRTALGQHEQIFVERPGNGRGAGIDHGLGAFGIPRRRAARHTVHLGTSETEDNSHAGARRKQQFLFHVVLSFRLNLYGYFLLGVERLEWTGSQTLSLLEDPVEVGEVVESAFVGDLRNVLGRVFDQHARSRPKANVVEQIHEALSGMPFDETPERRFAHVHEGLDLGDGYVPVEIIVQELHHLLDARHVVIDVVLDRHGALGEDMVIALARQTVEKHQEVKHRIEPVFAAYQVLHDRLDTGDRLFGECDAAARILEHLLDRIELLLVDEPRFEQIGRKLHADLMDIGILRKIAVQPRVFEVGTRDQDQIPVGYFADGVAHDAGRPPRSAHKVQLVLLVDMHGETEFALVAVEHDEAVLS